MARTLQHAHLSGPWGSAEEVEGNSWGLHLFSAMCLLFSVLAAARVSLCILLFPPTMIFSRSLLTYTEEEVAAGR